MRLLNKEIDNRLIISLDKTIKKDGVQGLMMFGERNDYPQIIEKLINGSVTAKSVANIYAKFLTGYGFADESINNTVIGKDQRGKEITILSLLRQISISCAYHSGYYIQCNINANAEINDVHLKPFKDCRFSKPDDINYVPKILYYDSWAKANKQFQYDKKKWKDYNVFNLDKNAIGTEIEKSGGIKKYKGQIFFQFMDDQYFYPLSIFDSVYMDMDTEAQISLYQNRETRDGFYDKVILRVVPAGSEEEKEDFKQELIKQIGPDGDRVILLEDEIDENGEIRSVGAFKVDKVGGSINDKLFETWQDSLKNKIRKAGKGIPEVLIDYDAGKLGVTSGEALIQATNFYNAITNDDRSLIASSFKQIFSNSINPKLREYQDWNIVPLSLKPSEKTTYELAIEERLKAQSQLKGSVGGVQALIQLQQSVSNGYTDLDAAIATLIEIYGLSEDVAKRMIGQPKQVKENGNTTTIPTTGN